MHNFDCESFIKAIVGNNASALSKQASSLHGSDVDAFMIAGNFQYASYLQVVYKIYVPYNSHAKMVGLPVFSLRPARKNLMTAVDLRARENVPLMS